MVTLEGGAVSYGRGTPVYGSQGQMVFFVVQVLHFVLPGWARLWLESIAMISSRIVQMDRFCETEALVSVKWHIGS